MRGVAVCSRVADATSRAVALVRAGETRDTGATPRPTWARSLVFVGAGVSDVIGAFVGAVVAVMRATPVHDAHSSSTARRPDCARWTAKHGKSGRSSLFVAQRSELTPLTQNCRIESSAFLAQSSSPDLLHASAGAQ